MVNYQDTKIYRIWSDKGDLEYIGATTTPLSNRLAKHKSDYKYLQDGKSIGKTSSYNLFEEYGVENCYIELIENYPCNTKIESNIRETFYIKLYREKLTNKYLSHLSNYRKTHIDHIKEVKKDYYENNKQEINIKRSETKITCICGSEFRKDGKTDHENSIKHITFMKTIEPNYKNDKLEELEAIRVEQNKKERETKITCICGSTIRKNGKAEHEHSKKHQNYINSIK